MKTLRKTEALFECVIMEKGLTSQKLYSYGLTPKDIKDFKDLGYIETLKKGTFSFKAHEQLLSYIESLKNIDSNLLELYTNFCEKDEEIQFIKALHQIKELIRQNDYNQTYNLCTNLLTRCSNHTDFISLVILLLNNFTDSKNATNFSISNFSNLKDPEKIKLIDLILNKKYTTALNLIGKSESFKEEEKHILSHLLNNIISKSKNDIKALKQLVLSKQYSVIISYLEAKEVLSKLEKYILCLSKKYLEIYKTKALPVKESMKEQTLNEAISTNNFDKALEIASNLMDDEDNVLIPVLKDIKNLTLQLTSKDNCTNFDQSEMLKKSIQYLDSYLKSINHTEYKEITIDLIKISLLGEDSTFSKVKNFLAILEEPSFKLNIGDFIQEFYYYLSKGNTQIAKHYLNIIDKLNLMGNEIYIITGLHQMFDMTVKKMNFVNSYQPISTKEEIVKASNNPLFNSLFELLEGLVTPLQNAEYYLSDKYKELLSTKTIVILDPFNESRTEELERLILDYEDISSFKIRTNKGTQLVLRYSKLDEMIIIKDTLAAGYQAYQSEDYQLCIEYFEKLVKLFNIPNQSIFAHLAISYFRLGYLKEAETYLTIGNALAIEQNRKTLNLSYYINESQKSSFLSKP